MKKETPKQIKNFLNYSSSIRGLTKDTVQAYRYDLLSFFRFVIAERNSYVIDDVTDDDLKRIDVNLIRSLELEDVYNYLSFLENERGNSNTTRARKIACLKSYFRYLYTKSKVIDRDIGVELEKPKTSGKLPIYMTIFEAQRLLEFVKGRNRIRDTCILIIFLNTGARLSELCGINVGDIKENSLTVTGKGNKQRTVYLNEMCIDSINEYIEKYRLKKLGIDHPELALFISERKQRINKRTVEHVMQRAIKSSALSTDYSVHKLRHTAATMLYNAGADIRSLQTILGHANVSTTQIYTHVNDKTIRDVMDLNPLNKK